MKRACAGAGIGVIGDVPFFVAHESAEVWAHPELFQLEPDGRPSQVAGVPPDYFSRNGQLWGNPLYRWDVLRRQAYGWWADRLAAAFDRFDAVRLDHFIGFHRCWAVPRNAKTARVGVFVKGPGAELFRKLQRRLGTIPLIAEDLGTVTPQVEALRDRFGFPGMRVLQFAFGGDPGRNPHLPHAYPPRCVVYTGTHDNDTIMGWFRCAGGEQTRALEYLGLRRNAARLREFNWEMVRLALISGARLAIVPMQDLLGLGSGARMNRPGIAEGNWEWRLAEGALTDALADRLHALTRVYGR